MSYQRTGSPPVPICYRHPGRETYVRCVRCNRPICPDCMHEAAVGFQCPECVNAGARTVRQPRTVFGGGLGGDRGLVTIGLVVLNVLVFVLELATSSNGLTGGSVLLGSKITQLQADLGVWPNGIAFNHEYWRLVTAMFVHFGVLHIAMNMYVLWVLGRYLERALGPVRFLALYLVCGIGGNVVVFLFSNPKGLSAGASTAVFGLFSAMFFINRKLGLSTSSVVVMIVINLVFTFSVPNISIWGHVGGLATGVLAGLGMAYAPQRNRTLVQFLVLGGILFVLVLLTLFRTAQLTG
jgi:membrane associated rhomboid family serine protease